MSSLEGNYFDGRHPVAEPASMDLASQGATLTAASFSGSWEISLLRVSPRVGATKRFITLPNGGQFVCADQEALDGLPQESPSEGPVAWLEERLGVALACVALVACMLLGGYFFGLPLAAERIAARIPMEAEQSFGRQILAWLDEKALFGPTRLNPGAQATIQSGFDRLVGTLPMKRYYRLEFRSGPANAFALPGGTIVITDAMVRATESPEEVLAVLAHEIGHVELRHAMRSLLQNSIIAAATAAVTSDAASLSAAVAGVPVIVAQTKYSRDFEAAADDYGFRLLRAKGYSPAAFAALMERLDRAQGKERDAAFSYLSTHPITEDRVHRAREAAAPDK